MLAGLAGLVIPVYPGLLIIWIASLVYGILYGFDTLGIVLFVFETIFMIVGEFIDNIFMAASTRSSGVPWLTIGAAMLAGLVGAFIHPLIGIVAAPLTLFILELHRLKNRSTALHSIKMMLTGWGKGLIIRFGFGIIMVLLWIIWVWKG